MSASRQVILTFDESDEWFDRFWLTRDYIPRAVFAGTMVDGVSQVCDVIQPSRVEVVPVPFDCEDGFFCAYWRDPRAYLDPDVRAAISALALLDDADLRPGLTQLAADLVGTVADAATPTSSTSKPSTSATTSSLPERGHSPGVLRDR